MGQRFVSYKHHFLVAMPELNDPNFRQTVVYLVEHHPQGAMGLIINRPTEITLGQLFERVEAGAVNPLVADAPVFYGGPVATERGFVLHRPSGEWAGSMTLPDEMALTSSRDILPSLGDTNAVRDFLVLLGHAGWGEGQLESEIARNDWLTVPANPEIIFSTPPEARYQAALALLGVRPGFLVGGAGHG
ncbi:YqgE/AlgH family protein [Hydrogenophilus thiooxidans]|uniref:YqgE/AlgH family protein n=1 Tax=Hydrogenophilus thiooxidans TaxID=2820326 RepID=UPI001C227D93|nr:YqgE/AlgH family protein [Hydrogenophilus thiooxidans]